MTYWIRPLESHVKMGADAGTVSNPYPETSHAGNLWRAGNAYHNGTPTMAMGALMSARAKREQLAARLPSIAELVDLIGQPLDKWPGNCATISTAVMPHLNLDRPAMLAYGFYTGPVAPGTKFSGAPMIRHGWIETLDGIVIDPTYWVFTGSEPALHVTTIEEHDYGMMRYKAKTPFPPPSSTFFDIALSPEAMQVAEEWTGLEGVDGKITLAGSQASWLGERPTEMLGLHFYEIITSIADTAPGILSFDAIAWRDANRDANSQTAQQAA